MNESMNNVAMFLNVYEKQPLITQPTPTKTNKQKKTWKKKNIEIVVKFHMNSQVTTN